MKVYLSEHIHEDERKRLASFCEITDSFEHPEELDGIIVRRAKVTRDIIKKASRLKIISMHGVGLDTIDITTAREYGIPVTNVPGESAESVAELTVSFIMALSRKLKYVDAGLQDGDFHAFGEPSLIGHELYGKRLGLVGSGHIAQRVAEIMKLAFHCQIFCYNPHRSRRELCQLGFQKMDTLSRLFQDCDIVSIHVPLTSDTADLINEAVFENANPELMLVNTSRGGIVNEKALYKALTLGRIKAAASDVFDAEVPDPSSPLLHLSNFIGSLHIGASTEEALKRVSHTAVDNIIAALSGHETKTPCVWQH